MHQGLSWVLLSLIAGAPCAELSTRAFAQVLQEPNPGTATTGRTEVRQSLLQFCDAHEFEWRSLGKQAAYSALIPSNPAFGIVALQRISHLLHSNPSSSIRRHAPDLGFLLKSIVVGR